jgi:hypothetical protein
MSLLLVIPFERMESRMQGKISHNKRKDYSYGGREFQ